jgi:uncharacterized protein (TIGR03792 family)
VVVEVLAFRVAAAERAEWLEVEERVWSRYLETRPGFVRKEMWTSPDDPESIHAVIWWETRDAWKAIAADEVAAVDARMGPWFRPSTCAEYQVVRQR